MSILLEQEVKFRLSSWEEGLSKLSRLGAVAEKERYFEVNQLFDFPDRRLETRDQALRLRTIGNRAWLTFKGPQHGSGKIKQRRELETSLGDGAALEATLVALGLEQSFRYEKYRATFSKDGVELTLDETPLGVFLEIEGTPERISETAERLSLEMTEAIIASYPRLYALHRREMPEAPELMVFEEQKPPGR